MDNIERHVILNDMQILYHLLMFVINLIKFVTFEVLMAIADRNNFHDVCKVTQQTPALVNNIS